MRTEFSMALRYARKEAGLTQKELASVLGVATGTVQQWELGIRFPRVEMLKRIEDTLEIALVPQIIEEDENGTTVYVTPESLAQYKGKRIDPRELAKVFSIISEVQKEEQGRLKIPLTMSYEFLHQQKTMQLLYSFNHLNDEGKSIAVERIEELALIPKYQRTDSAEQPERPPEENVPTTQGKPPEG